MRRTLPLFSLLLGLGLGLGLVSLPACSGGGSDGGCTTDADCKGMRICNYDNGRCELPPGEGCEINADCSEDQLCHPEEQVCYRPECLSTDECGEGLRCAEDQTCVEKDCENTAQCDPGLFCEPVEGFCVACNKDADCGDGMQCVDFACEEAEPCWLDEPPTCDGTKYQDDRKGDFDPSAYPYMLLLDPDVGEGVHQEGTARVKGAAQGGENTAYWPLTRYDEGSGGPLNIFGASTGVPVNQVWQLVDRDLQPVGRPILKERPHSTNFSPLQHFIYVEVPPENSGYEPDMIKSYSTLQKAMGDLGWGEPRYRLDVTRDDDVVVFQPVSKNVEISNATLAGAPQFREWWYDGQIVYGYLMPTSLDSDYVPIKSVSGDPIQTPPTPFVPRSFMVYYDGGTRAQACLFGGSTSVLGSPMILETGFGEATYSPVVKSEVVMIPSDELDYRTACASVPRDYAGVSELINAGEYVVEPGAIHMVLPQAAP